VRALTSKQLAKERRAYERRQRKRKQATDAEYVNRSRFREFAVGKTVRRSQLSDESDYLPPDSV